MKKLYIKTSTVIQGDFKYRDLNIILVFQVNCPGCFVYSLPLAIRLYEHYPRDVVSILGLSTAFEDFDLNTAENTALMVKCAETVGEAKKALNAMGHSRLPYKISFPVAFDLVGKPEEIISDLDIENICRYNHMFKSRDEIQMDVLKKGIRDYFKNYHAIGYTFGVNMLNGTPSWIMFNKDMEVLDQWFGHRKEEDIISSIHKHIVSFRK